jgi:hypothetical protein
MGGGFDVFCGLPVYFELKKAGKEVHLANFSFSNVVDYNGGKKLTDTLAGVNAKFDYAAVNFPEIHLSRWFLEHRKEDITIWCFQKTGADPLLNNYNILIKHLNIDGVILTDGGVDSLMTGDEEEMGTLIEDAISLFAVNELRQ